MNKRKQAIRTSILLAALLLLTAVVQTVTLHAQGDDEKGKRLIITGITVDSLPAITLQTIAIDENGDAISLTPALLQAYHNGLPVTIDSVLPQEVGTLTLFLVDVPPGVSDQIPAIQNAILQYASSTHMKEQVDYVAIYQVGEKEAIELLPPDMFHNSVRNLFAAPLEPADGITALNDSSIDLLNQVASIKPQEDMIASLVIISDGTDATSRAEVTDVAELAAELSIPLYALWVDNADLGDAGKRLGQETLHDWASASRGYSFDLNDMTGLSTIWGRIGDFRNQSQVTYIADMLTGGEATIELALAEDEELFDETAVFIPDTAPILAITLPPEDRVLMLPSVEKPIKLHFNSELSWVDGEARTVEAAHLVVNNVAHPIPVDSVSEFTIEVENLVFGQNRIAVAILDANGMNSSSSEIILTVDEGNKQIPETLQPPSGFRAIGKWVLFLIVAATAVYFAWKKEVWKKMPFPKRRPRRRPNSVPLEPVETVLEQSAPEEEQSENTLPLYVQEKTPNYPPPHAVAYIEILASETENLPDEYALHGTEIKIGRSSDQADIIFENDPTVSRLHLLLLLENGRYHLYDQNSSGGTWVNDQRAPAYGVPLNNGDELHLGAVHLRYRQEE